MTPIGNMIKLARQADRAGVDSLWVAEHVGYRDGLASSMALLTATTKITVASAATSIYSRHPMITAMTAATLAEYAPERVILTMATGNPRAHGKEMGLDLEHPVAVMREYVQVLRALWSGRPLTFSGEYFRLADATFYVLPRKQPPLFVAAIGPRMLELAGEIADGAVFSAGLSPSALRRCIELVRVGASRAGRHAETVSTVAILIAAVGRDSQRARRQARAFFAYALRNRFIAENAQFTGTHIDVQAAADAAAHGDWDTATALIPDEALGNYAIAGTRDECTAQLKRFLVDGLDVPVLLPLGDDEAREEAVKLAGWACEQAGEGSIGTGATR
jgi:alkanesulfonate monooxygenase SsuD/methylene tetrahydromethanopterin reductase-like flavin-dependent oxidoreductase (luciferase family)